MCTGRSGFGAATTGKKLCGSAGEKKKKEREKQKPNPKLSLQEHE